MEDEALQESLCESVVRDGLSVRQLEDRINRLSAARKPIVKVPQDLPEDYYKVLGHIGKYFENNISLKRSPSGKGTMTIRFDSDEEISRFLKALEEAKI